ncbi:hypothetical protein TNCV_3391811 [Trichonephila clavipes]|nr:hypothetical protein TNCV_3391811 [Trichonephila clavipes]
MNPNSVSILISSVHACGGARPPVRFGICCREYTAITQQVTVWGTTYCNTRSPLAVLQCTLMSRNYVDDILTVVTVPLLSSHLGALPQKDRTPLHILRDSSRRILVGNDILPWPIRASNLHQSSISGTCLESNCRRPGILVN